MKSFLASGVDMDGFINDVAAAIDATKARLKSKHDVFISFDEWNVWYLNEEPSKNPEGIGNWWPRACWRTSTPPPTPWCSVI